MDLQSKEYLLTFMNDGNHSLSSELYPHLPTKAMKKVFISYSYFFYFAISSLWKSFVNNIKLFKSFNRIINTYLLYRHMGFSVTPEHSPT